MPEPSKFCKRGHARIPENLTSRLNCKQCAAMLEKSKRRATIFTLAQKYGWVCWYCNLPLASENVGIDANVRIDGRVRKISTHVDHIIPSSCGGTDDIDNLALACEMCNRAKLNMDAASYLEWLDRVRFSDPWTPIRDGRRWDTRPDSVTPSVPLAQNDRNASLEA